jgi:hypothetical protein
LRVESLFDGVGQGWSQCFGGGRKRDFLSGRWGAVRDTGRHVFGEKGDLRLVRVRVSRTARRFLLGLLGRGAVCSVPTVVCVCGVSIDMIAAEERVME